MTPKKFPSDDLEVEVKKGWRLFRKKKPKPKPKPAEEKPIEEKEFPPDPIEEKEGFVKTALMTKFETETGKKAIWGGKITKGFLKWKESA